MLFAVGSNAQTASHSTFAREHLVCKVFANIMNEKGKVEAFQVWGDKGNSPMSWDLSYLDESRVFSFSAQVKNGKISGQINYHVNGNTTAYGEAEGNKLVVRFENDKLFTWAENLGFEKKEGDKYPEIRGVELSCSADK